ncbi:MULTISPECIES: lipoteichoic acid biosynthesis protein CozEa [Staphylococcus]|jgi:predicted PurR-regulated permease PerM|uniref:AI-2E family transporter n=1 Tax=Staphylococcus nepalensis TaxID=214473 RepID=A0A380GPL3_9STAP|nr:MULTISPECIES: AI-2E family transporter [Staphylococcus]VDG67595.1 putative permease [Lacrimispora indolis]MBO1206796.1 AI-2E family transporter [Staphylococcus nepalensis]MBO1213979.1 AI-2E family transporter [Staphylococcus nepalensis]MBO1216969.1 AI-2E family transporter [Staphylococcus nepalensis]MBO1227887.1 AI-2E family transporter [Staphylococcus nepalensis]
MLNKVWFRTGIALLILFLLVKLVMEVHTIFTPFIIILQSVLLPLLLSGFLFYICLPFQKILEKNKIPRWGSITIIFIGLIIIIGIVIGVLAPLIAEQIENLVNQIPALQHEAQHIINFALDQMERLPNDVTDRINKMVQSMSDSIAGILSNSLGYLTSFISTLFLLIMVPFFLIYMLKDHERFIPFIARLFKGDRKVFTVELLKDLNETVKSYIQGQVTVSIILGIILYIGYSIVGLNYTLLLVMFACVANMIPFLGPWMAFVPAGVIAIIQSPTIFIWVCIITLVAQQLEGNVITPNVMGKSLSIHPLTIIVVILAAGNLGGFGLILIAVPLYAVIKTVVRNVFRYRQDIIAKANSDVKE